MKPTVRAYTRPLVPSFPVDRRSAANVATDLDLVERLRRGAEHLADDRAAFCGDGAHG